MLDFASFSTSPCLGSSKMNIKKMEGDGSDHHLYLPGKWCWKQRWRVWLCAINSFTEYVLNLPSSTPPEHGDLVTSSLGHVALLPISQYRAVGEMMQQVLCPMSRVPNIYTETFISSHFGLWLPFQWFTHADNNIRLLSWIPFNSFSRLFAFAPNRNGCHRVPLTQCSNMI